MVKPSQYLLDVARRNIEGDITIDEVRQLLDTYYSSKTKRTPPITGLPDAMYSRNSCIVISLDAFAQFVCLLQFAIALNLTGIIHATTEDGSCQTTLRITGYPSRQTCFKTLAVQKRDYKLLYDLHSEW